MLKRCLRHVENLSDEGNRSSRGLVGFQVGNLKRSDDLVNCQEGRGDILNSQVIKGGDMSSVESSHQGVLTYEDEVEEIPHSDGYSQGTVNHVNEDDEKLNTSC
jgi:hypothetical protein